MAHFVVSNSQKVLADRFYERLRRRKSLKPVDVLFGRLEAASWVYSYLASQGKTVGNVKSSSFSVYFRKKLEPVFKDQVFQDYQKDIFWVVLEEILEDDTLPEELRDYLSHLGETAKVSLADELSALYVRYYELEPSLLEKKSSHWHLRLLRKILERRPALKPVQKLDLKQCSFPEELHVFAAKPNILFSIPELFGEKQSLAALQAFREACKKSDVYVYLYYPLSEKSWRDFKCSSLLMEGSLEFFRPVRRLVKEIYGADIEEAFVEEEEDTALGRLQKAVRNLEDFEKETDSSLTVVSACSELREVEGLKEFVLSEVERGTCLHEIAVFSPDLDRYSRLLPAVFSYSAPKVPYSLMDREDIDQLVLRFLEAIKPTLTAVEFLDCLSQKESLEHFGMTLDDAAELKSLFIQHGARRGLRALSEKSSVFENSLFFGFERLMMAVHSSGEDVPLSFSTTRLVSKAFLILSRLEDFLEESREEKTLAEWRDFTERVIEAFLLKGLSDAEVSDFLKKVSEMIPKLEAKVSYQVFKELVKRKLFKEARCCRIDGRVLFADLKSLHSIPFKVCCFLGADAERFPRRKTFPSFYALEKDFGGFLNPSQEDRALFIDRLLNCQKIRISFVGMDETDGKPRAPSVIVSEFFDTDSAEVLPFQPYEGRFKSLWTGFRSKKPFPELVFPLEKAEEVSPSDFSRILIDPIRFSMEQRGIYFNVWEDVLETEEPQKFDSRLFKVAVAKSLSETARHDQPLKSFFLRLKERGLVPARHLGDFLFEQEDFRHLASFLEALEGLENCRLEKQFPSFKLSGHLGHKSGDRLVFFWPSEKLTVVLKSYLLHMLSGKESFVLFRTKPQIWKAAESAEGLARLFLLTLEETRPVLLPKTKARSAEFLEETKKTLNGLLSEPKAEDLILSPYVDRAYGGSMKRALCKTCPERIAFLLELSKRAKI